MPRLPVSRVCSYNHPHDDDAGADDCHSTADVSPPLQERWFLGPLDGAVVLAERFLNGARVAVGDGVVVAGVQRQRLVWAILFVFGLLITLVKT